MKCSKRLHSWLLVLVGLMTFSSCHSQENCCPEELTLGTILVGRASYYGPKFHGKQTANGEKMDKTSLTCAHPEFPFGTMLEVTNLTNGKRVIVRVNDRGPYSGTRILDISLAAAKQISMVQKGIQQVSVMAVGCCGEVYLERDEPPTIQAVETRSDSTHVNYK